MDKDTRKVLREAEKQGFTYSVTAKNHFQVRNPAGEIVAYLPSTGSDVRGMKNAIADLRKAGFVWPPKGKGR